MSNEKEQNKESLEKKIKYFFDKEFQDITDSMYEFFKRINFYSTWGSNVSLGLLGFYLAVLLQFRETGTLPNRIYSLIVLIILSISLIIGLFVFLNHETNDIKKKMVDTYKKLLWKLFEAKKEGQLTKEAELKIDKLNPKMSQLEKQINFKFNKWIITQFILVIISIGLIVFDIIRYLFYK